MTLIKAAKEWAALQTALLDLPAGCDDDPRFTQDDSLDEFLRPICNACPVKQWCRDYSVKAKPPGYWAGHRFKGWG